MGESEIFIMAKTTKPETEVLTTKVAGVSVKAVKKTWTDGKVSADVTLSIGKADIVTIYGVRVVDGSNGAFLSMPSRKGNDDKYYYQANIIDEDIKSALLELLTE